MAKRPYGSGSIRFKDASFHFTLRLNGKKKTFLLHAKNEDEAQTEADAILQRFKVLNDFDTKEQLAVFIGKAKNLIVEEKDFCLESGFDYFKKDPARFSCGVDLMKLKEYVWNRFVCFCKGIKISRSDEVELVHLLSFRNELRETLSAKTCNEYLRMVQQILRSMGVSKERFDGFQPLPYSSEPMQFFTAKELAAVMESVDGGMKLSLPYRDEMKVLFRILAWSGLRLKDACLFNWKSVHFQNGTILTFPFKTIKSSGVMVSLPIHPDLDKALKTALQWRDDSGYVLPHVAKRYLANKSCLQHEIVPGSAYQAVL